MNDNKVEKKDYEIDMRRLLAAVLQKSWLVMLVAIGCAIAVFIFTLFCVTPLYESTAMFYVNNSNVSIGEASLSISSADITAAKSLVDSYIVILNTRTTMNDVIDYAGVDRTFRELKNMVSASSVNATEIFQVVVTSPDPKEAEQIANAIAYILPKRISSIIEGTSAQIVDAAVVASAPSSPSYVQNTLVGFVLGFALSVMMILLREIFDVTIRSEEDVTQSSPHPILAAVPDMTAASKGGYYYSSDGGKKKTRKKTLDSGKSNSTVGGNISFAASEAYKLLRTKLQFSFADESDCHVIGVSSSMAGEGKSTSAVNLAYTLAQLDNRVLLIECDLRRPSISAKIPVSRMPGLTNFLTRQESIEDIIQVYEPDDAVTFHVVTSGRVPPNPIELLSSNRMEKVMNAFRKNYDYIILDLPPVGEVSDALVAAKLVDGMLLVVRQNYCNRLILEDTVRQFEFVGARILGMVVSYASEGGNGYGSYKYGKKYYKRYYNKQNKQAAGRYASDRKTVSSKAETEKTDE